MSSERDESGLPQNRLWQPTTAKWFLVVFGACLGYAVVRYHVVGSVAWEHFPLFILNKVISLAATVFIACSYLVGRVIKWHNHDKAMRLVVVKFCGLMGFFLAVAHILCSFLLMNPSYFAKYFNDDGRMNAYGEIGMIAGAVAICFLVSPAITTLPMMPAAIGGQRWKRAQRIGYVALILVVAHLVALGIRGWMAPGKWSGMPPISLLAVAVALVPNVFKGRELLGRRRDA